jgi:hypothetical protein
MTKRFFLVLFPIALLIVLAVPAPAETSSDMGGMESGQCSMHQSEGDQPMSCCMEAMEKTCTDCCGDDCQACCGEDCQSCCMTPKPCSCGDNCEAGKCAEDCMAPCSGTGACCVDAQCSDCPEGCDCCAKAMGCGLGLCSTEGQDACCAEDACLMGNCATGECECCTEHCAQCCTGCNRMSENGMNGDKQDEGGSVLPCCEASSEGAGSS